MVDENIEDQLVTVPKLARLLAKDRSFVSKIGLDECPPDMLVPALERIFGFILGMYENAKDIFTSNKNLTLDEKFVRLIYSRLMLMSWWAEKPADAPVHSKETYEYIKWHRDRSKSKWGNMSVYAKFFEVCVYVLFEENISVMRMVDEHKWDTGADSRLVTRPALFVACEGVFSHVNWELDGVGDTASDISSLKGVQKWKSKNTTDDWLIKPELAFIYMIHKRMIRDNRKHTNKLWSTNPEEDFWINFIVITWYTTWNNKSQVEVNLSEILRLYLRIYREDIKPEMTAEEEPEFLDLLKETLYKASQAFEPPVDVAWLKTNPSWRLAQLVFGKDATLVDTDTPVIKQVGVGLTMISVMNSLAGTIPFKLVKDI
ncbi:MAG TPA: hypothetical protein HPP66_08680 [Planctomycetes bacterium]|nr:hypothetical protein [Planctomycetota bacterium]